ncbi:MAG: enoyl-CoA hydratase-related protein [Paracoccaceae bacterium]|nr:enoyl-CoA hydratase-related protein [Paracoccaceae bacterium]
MGREEQVALVERVQCERSNNVVVVTIDNPPTASLSAEVRRGLMRALDEVDSSDATAVVITGTAKAFATGAGLNETIDPGTPDLAEICDRIEAFAKPVVVAIDGPALGGGLELAVAAHLRVSTPHARLGAPEITLGLVPNAGGTQRLPKLVGGIAALKLFLSGRSVSGQTAHKLGLVDQLASEDLLQTAIQLASQLGEDPSQIRRSSERRDRLGEGTAFLESVAAHRKAADAAPLDAPYRMIECIEAALLLPFDIGRGMEQAAYEDLVNSEHSKSLRHVFSAERQLQATTRWEGRVASRQMTGVTVVGARGLGAEVAVQCLDAGYKVTVAEINEEALEDGAGRIIGHFDGRVAAGKMTEDEVEQVLDRMHAVAGYDRVGEADVVIDPMPLLTRARVAELDAAMKAGAILVLGCEKVDVGTVAATTGRASDVIGMRFFPGVRKNRLVELTVTDATGPRAIATARALARKLDRLIVETGPGKDAIGTVIIEALHAAADLCLEDGAEFERIDAALKDWGIPFGSFGWRDLTGIKRLSAPRGVEGERGGGIDSVLVSAGRLGMPTGRGYYVYQARGKPGVPDPDVQEMIVADREAKGVSPRRLSDGDIRARCVAAMAGAGAHLLDAGIARRSEDIDMVAVHGLGFARRTGGVMFAADLLGLDRVCDLVTEISNETTRIQPPAVSLQDLAAEHGQFSSLE